MVSDRAETLRAALAERYTLGREIGAGGMGTVYVAQDLKHHRRVALKVLRSEVSSSVGAERFLREVEIAAKLSHPHIVPLHDSGEADGVLYFVMPYVEGSSLKEHLEAEDALAVDRALQISRDVADGLAYAHEHGFVHRDIKPGNILLAGRHALIVDFGVARAAQVAASPSLTMPGIVIGSPMYMSPEQFEGSGDTDARSDIYSLGCVLYQMLTGTAPFQGPSTVAVFAGHLQGDVPPITSARPDVPPGVVSIVNRMLAKDPDERFQTAEDLVEAIELATKAVGAEGTAPAPRASRLKTAAILAATIGATALFVTSVSSRAEPLSLAAEAESVVVLPFHDAASTPEEKRLLIDLADELTRQLNRWESVRAVPQVALAGISFDLGLAGPTLDRIDDGIKVATQSGVRAFVTLNARLRGDTAVVTASQFDARNGREVGQPAEAIGEATDRFRLAAQLAHAMLGLEGAVDDVEQLRRQSANPEALAQQFEGRRHLESWKLQEAESAFRSAIDQDSAFAMAHHYLAITLYWQAARDPTRLASLGPEIGQESLTAIRHGGELPANDSTHIDAFYRFQLGDYERARSAYQALVGRDPTDVYALLLLGMVEYHDPWLVEGLDGSFSPRRNLNTALRSFGETVRLSPGFHLGYGHLFDITERVLSTADFGSGPGFQIPPEELISPWETLTPHNQVAFYPVATDSIAWLSYEDFVTTRNQDGVRAGADDLLRSSMRTLTRWALFAPTESRPFDELVDWTLRERARLPRPTAPARIDSLAAAALEYAERSIALIPDSTPFDLMRLGNLRLAVGDAEGAEMLVERAQALLEGERGRPSHSMASNVFLHRGKPSRALAILEGEQVGRRFYEDPVTGELLDDAGAEPTIARLRILGATDAAGPALTQELENLAGLMSPDLYAPDALRLLRARTAGRIALAVALDQTAGAEWVGNTQLSDPIWQVVRGDAGGPAAAGEALRAVELAEEREVTDAPRTYILGRAAQRSGNHADAVRYFARLDSLAFSITSRDPGWGLLSLSRFRRAQSYEELGDTTLSLEFYRLFGAGWSGADALVPPLASEAERGLARLGSANRDRRR